MGLKSNVFLAMTQPFLVNFIEIFDVRLGENLSISWDLQAKTPQNVGLIPSPLTLLNWSSHSQEGLKSKRCNRVYITTIENTYDCDVFFPKIPEEDFDIVVWVLVILSLYFPEVANIYLNFDLNKMK